MIEVNPRASRTIPFLSKCIGTSLAKIASKIILGKTLKELELDAEIMPTNYAVKAPVFPFNKFRKVDPILGPEMKSTGEIIYFISDLEDPFFIKVYSERNLYLSK